jgi:DNA-binding LacI/PurR family transcriptional regulator
MQKITSVDVAKLVGVSQSTVSRTFSNDKSVSPRTREKVLEAARKLGYTPNAIARSLITQQTNIIGIVMSNITSPFQPYVLEKFVQELQKLGRQALVFSTGPNQEVEDLLPSVLQYQVDGLIITSATLTSAGMAEVAQQRRPVVLFNRHMAGKTISVVCCDNVEGGRTVANLLLDTGHKKFAYIAGNTNSSTNRDREKGFSDRLWERALIKPEKAQANYTYESGYAAAERLLCRDNPPDAIFCGSDIIALGALDRARELRIKIPDDLAIVGFDDIPMASWSGYSLTTIRQPVDFMIASTLALLIEHIEEPESQPEIKLFPGQLVQRGSTRKSLVASPLGQN